MSTVLQSVWSEREGEIRTAGSDDMMVHLIVQGDGLMLSKKEFIAAVEKELDATVILHSDLPDVVKSGSWLSVDGILVCPVDATPQQQRNIAMKYLATADYLEKNPPVDEKMVGAVAAALYEATSDPNDINVPDVARRLVQQGVRVEVTE